MTKNKTFGSKKRSQDMTAWEKDEHDNFAGRQQIVYVPTVILGMIPIFGISIVFASYMTIHTMDGYIGVKQQLIRTGDIVVIIQAIVLLILGLFMV